MKKLLCRLIPAVLVAFGIYLLSLSYGTYATWQEYLALGDLSGAEAYEIEFWPQAIAGPALIGLGAFLLGRSMRR
jgi:hypothetical protein